MCLNIKYRKADGIPSPQIAERDIIVYKHLIRFNKTLVSPYQLFRYKKGWHYTEKLAGVGGIFKGFYSINRGLFAHVQYKKWMSKIQPWERVVEMTIPKGAQYYTNGIEIVSTDLIWYPDAKVHNS